MDMAGSLGLFSVSVTPFDESEDIDFDSLTRLCEFYIEKGVSALMSLGIMGEANRMSPSESIAISRHVLKVVDGRIPVYFGASNPSLKVIEELSEEVMGNGAAGIMVTPLAQQRDAKAILAYFKAVAKAVGPDAPLIMQDYPQQTDTHLSVSLISEIIQAVPSLCIFKHEQWPGLTKLSALRDKEKPERVRNMPILTGNGGLFLPQELARGANGTMTGFAFPEVMVKVCALFSAGQKKAAEDLFDIYLPYLRYENQLAFGLSVRKYVLYRRGIISTHKTRMPGYRLNKIDMAEIDHFLDRIGTLD